MEFGHYLRWIRADGDRMAAIAEMDLDAAVPSCPGWSVRDLVGHTGLVHRHKERIIREQWQDGEPEPVAPPGEGLIEWYRSGLDELLATLAAHDPAERVATWYPDDQSVGFWYRRMAAETVVHRVDAELALEVVTPIEVALAVDAVDEILVVMMTGFPPWADVTMSDRTVRLEATDAGRSWTLRFASFSGTSTVTGNVYEDEPTVVFTEVDDPETVITAASEDLLLFLWGRRSDEGLSVVGDRSAVADLRSIAADVTQ